MLLTKQVISMEMGNSGAKNINYPPLQKRKKRITRSREPSTTLKEGGRRAAVISFAYLKVASEKEGGM